MSKEYKTSEAQRKAVRKWTEEHKERKKELDRLHNIRRREKIKKEHQALLDIKDYLKKMNSNLTPDTKSNETCNDIGQLLDIVNKVLEGNNE